MAPAKKVIPASGHVYRVYSVLIPVLDISESARYQNVFEDAREMRFVLRKYVNAVTELTKAGSDDKSAYFEAAREASASHARPDVAETIGDRTTAALVKILGEAAWGVTGNRPVEQQSTNITLKGIRDGIDATIKSLSEQLKHEDAKKPETEEYDTPSSPLAAPETPSRRQQQGSTTGTPSRTPGSGKGNRGPRGAPWTTEEKLEVLRVVRDYPDGNHREHTEELNRRMAALRAARGENQQDPRTRDGFRQQVRTLGEDGATIEELEAALQ